MRRPAAVAASAAALLSAGLVAGCGSQGVTTATPQTVQGSVPAPTQTTPTAPAAKGDPVAGKAVFVSAGCSGCHTLKAANATGTVGPNLDQKKPPLALIVDRVTNGKGVMPSFKGSLSSKQIADVAAFVYQSTH
ncbi:MAG TPA: c-type cytochrome [Gaiellaceae bacterium]|nr:c-type cytochrome [Gaiellaceae bacterium]